MRITQSCLVVLLVQSELSKTPLVVFDHEAELLAAIHGQENIRKVPDEPPIPEGEFDTEDEFARLLNKYGGESVFSLWRNLEDFESWFTSQPTDKAALLEMAKSLGINANSNWGVSKLQAAIDAKHQQSS